MTIRIWTPPSAHQEADRFDKREGSSLRSYVWHRDGDPEFTARFSIQATNCLRFRRAVATRRHRASATARQETPFAIPIATLAVFIPGFPLE